MNLRIARWTTWLPIATLLGASVYLELHVKVLPRWRRHDASLKRLGYVP